MSIEPFECYCSGVVVDEQQRIATDRIADICQRRLLEKCLQEAQGRRVSQSLHAYYVLIDTDMQRVLLLRYTYYDSKGHFSEREPHDTTLDSLVILAGSRPPLEPPCFPIMGGP